MEKQDNIVVAFGCLGSPIHLDENASRFNGASQYSALLKALLRNPRIKNIVIMGTLGSNTEKKKLWEELDPENKIIYPLPMVHRIAQHVWGKDAKFPSFREPDENGEKEFLPYKLTRPFQDLYAKYCKEQLPSIDFGLFFISQGWCGTNINGLIRKKTNPKEYRLQLPMAAEKAGPFVHALNHLGIPWFIVSPDDRVVYSMPRHDTLNMPKEVIGQWHAEYEWETIDSYSDGYNMTKKPLIVNYGAVEKLNLIDSNIVDPSNERSIKFSVVANQSTHRNDLTCQRFEQLKTWILNDPRTKDYNIYGEWSPAYITGYEEDGTKESHRALIDYNKKYNDYSSIPKEDIIYPQFKGRVDASVVDEVFQNTRYTVCFPVIPGYLTWKWWESLVNGCLPFIPPFYDEQFNSIPSDSVLRVNNPDELHAKIEYFEQNPEHRIKVVRFYQNEAQKCQDGSYIYKHINDFLDRHNVYARI